MSDIIHQLPDSVANQIAAGEVVQRPASVIKELVENSVDAGAKNINIFIRDAGRTLIQVVDDGSGMSENDARMAFERHATSKINQATDLFTLATMGFRGEALPSICAISQVELRTKTADAEIGTCLRINCARKESSEPCVCEKGTNIMVKNLFCNIPARRKFLKSDNVELANIMREFERLALVNNDIRLSIDTGNKVLDLRPATFKQRIADIWKNNLNLQLLPIEIDTSVIKISGFVSRPEFARRRNPLQYLITNGRNMRHPYFHKAIVSCFEQLIAPDTQPCYFLKFQVDPASIDVNIHPTKNEIKFENEKEIWHILTAAIRAALGKFSAVPSIDFEADPLPANITNPGDFIDVPKIDIDPSYNPFEQATASTPPFIPPTASGTSGSFGSYSTTRDSANNNTANKISTKNWNRLYADFMAEVKDSDQRKKKQQAEIFNSESDDKISAPIEESPSFLQQGLKYIVTTSSRGILIIDQHRAHVKVLYEEFMQKATEQRAVGQHIMFPQIIDLEPAQALTLEGIEDELHRMGFILTNAGSNRWQIEAVPSQLINKDSVDVIMRILESVSDDTSNYGKESSPETEILQRMALIMARSAAICGGQKLTHAEMEHLVSKLFQLPDSRLTPNGNPIISIVDPTTIL